jgi:quinol monooxygenase YgiN
MTQLHRRGAIALLIAAFGACATEALAADEAQYVASYVETPVAGAAAVERSVLAYADGLRKQASAPSVVVLRELGRAQRIAVIERWPAGATPNDTALAQALEGKLQAPLDRRLHRPLGALLPASASGGFHMLMHVDVVPAGAETANKLLDAHRAAVSAARGAVGYEVAVQSDRPNHFAVHSVWTNRAAYEAYAASAAGQELRKQLAVFKGGLFDDRFFVAVR